MAKVPSKPTTSVKKTVSKRAKPAAKLKPAASAKPAAKAKPVIKAKTPARKTTVSAAKAKTAAPKTTAKKTAAKKTTAKKVPASTLQSQANAIESRLKRANTLTRNQLRQLDTDFKALASQLSRTKSSQTKLTRRVTLLSKTLTQDLSDIQADVRRDLSQALANPTLEGLQQAFLAAETRLGESEAAQAETFSRINHHISELATIVERRLSEEAQARGDAMAQMREAQSALASEHTTYSQAMKLRLAELQTESANAIRVIGDKVVDVAEEMGRRRESLGIKIREEMREAVIDQDTELKHFRNVVERRLEALESDARAVDNRIDRAIAPISSRIEGLEYGIAAAPAPAQIIAAEAPALPAVPALSIAAEQTSNVAAVSPHMSAEPIQPDAFTPAPLAPPIHVAPPPAEPMASPSEPQPLAVPYDPAAYASSVYAPAQPEPALHTPIHTQPYAQTQPQTQPQTLGHLDNPYAASANAAYAPTDAPFQPQQGLSHQLQPTQIPANSGVQLDQNPPFPDASDLPLAEGDLPYADPAYAEANDQSMESARPGGRETVKKLSQKFKNRRPAKPAGEKSSLLTPRNVKLGGMAAALGLITVIGAQTLLPKSGTENTSPLHVAENGALPPINKVEGNIAVGDQILSSPNQALTGNPASTIESTIGKYDDNRLQAMAGTDTVNSELSAAADSGHPVAQLQLGLIKLESGNIEDGVKLIRASANQDQAAALYRLAKLYETGQGVGKDPETARKLTERAARGGNRIAMHDLALYHAEGRGGVAEVDMPTAAKWFEKAAERGVVDSQFNLGVLFESGQGLPQDNEAALVWYSIAGSQGDQMAAGRVGILRKTLAEAQITRADQRIASFTPARIDDAANGIFVDLPWAKSRSNKNAQKRAKNTAVVETQSLLNELGYDVGSADGAIGPKTRNAIKSFERVNGLPETGQVSADLIERLEIATGA